MASARTTTRKSARKPSPSVRKRENADTFVAAGVENTVPTQHLDDSEPAINGAAQETASGKETLLDNWDEPPLAAPTPSFEHNKGVERQSFSTLQNMQPLGTLPSAKLIAKIKADHSNRVTKKKGKKGKSKKKGKAAKKRVNSNGVTAQNTPDAASTSPEAPEVEKRVNESTSVTPPPTQDLPATISTPTNPIIGSIIAPSPSTSILSGRTSNGLSSADAIFTAAIKKATSSENGTLKLALERLHSDSLNDPHHSALLQAILTDQASSLQISEFKQYIKMARQNDTDSNVSKTSKTSKYGKSGKSGKDGKTSISGLTSDHGRISKTSKISKTGKDGKTSKSGLTHHDGKNSKSDLTDHNGKTSISGLTDEEEDGEISMTDTTDDNGEISTTGLTNDNGKTPKIGLTKKSGRTTKNGKITKSKAVRKNRAKGKGKATTLTSAGSAGPSSGAEATSGANDSGKSTTQRIHLRMGADPRSQVIKAEAEQDADSDSDSDTTSTTSTSHTNAIPTDTISADHISTNNIPTATISTATTNAPTTKKAPTSKTAKNAGVVPTVRVPNPREGVQTRASSAEMSRSTSNTSSSTLSSLVSETKRSPETAGLDVPPSTAGGSEVEARPSKKAKTGDFDGYVVEESFLRSSVEPQPPPKTSSGKAPETQGTKRLADGSVKAGTGVTAGEPSSLSSRIVGGEVGSISPGPASESRPVTPLESGRPAKKAKKTPRVKQS